MELRTINPRDGVYHATEDYVHALEVRSPSRFLFVSGTMGLDVDGTPGATLDEQLVLVWRNIHRILEAADMTTDNIVRLTSYLRDAAYVPANQEARLAQLGDRRIPTTAIVVETLVDDWLVELEIVAAA